MSYYESLFRKNYVPAFSTVVPKTYENELLAFHQQMARDLSNGFTTIHYYANRKCNENCLLWMKDKIKEKDTTNILKIEMNLPSSSTGYCLKVMFDNNFLRTKF